MATYTFSSIASNSLVSFNPLSDILVFDTSTRPAELLINATASGVQISVGGKSIVLTGIGLDDLGVNPATGRGNVQFVSPGALLVGEGTTGHEGNLDNPIRGGAGDDALIGLGGADRLDGGAGGDLMVGGLGDDTYVVDNAADVVTEENNSLAGAGLDLVAASVSYTLTNYVENLTLTGTGAINGTGNTLDNRLLGNAAANVLDGRSGEDTMIGGDGNDTYLVDDRDDVVSETNSALGQIDTVMAGVSYALGANLEDLVLTGSSGYVGIGNHRDNHLTGNRGDNTLNGWFGADTMTGGDGDDVYIVDDAGDVVVETNPSASDIDLVASEISHTLGENLENLRLLGSANIDGTGNGLDNVIFASAGNNRIDGMGGIDTASYASASLMGLAGRGSLSSRTTVSSVSTLGVTVDLNITGVQDTQGSGFDVLAGIENLTGSGFCDELTGNAGNNVLDGGGGADLLTGGDGDDTFVVDGADVVVEQDEDDGGLDTVQSSVSYRLAANVEYLVLTGSALSGIGNNLDNRITGNSSGNVLDGRAGADKMAGGGGNDTYVADNLGDEITDTSGTDLVMTYVNQTLGSSVENLRLMGTNALNGTGNASNNIIWVNIGDNVVDGGAGTGDTISYEYGATAGVTVDLGRSGSRQATGGSGSDLITGFENLTGSRHDDLLSGDGARNTLDGLSGIDTVSYAAAAAGVTIDLTTGQATTAVGDAVQDLDTLRNFENIIGSSFDDLLVGDLGANVFRGGTGSDTVSYRNVLRDGGGVVADLMQTGAQNTLAAGVDTLIGIENLVGTLNGDVLTGSAVGNLLDGDAGDDLITGGEGNDTLVGGLGNDTLRGNAGSDSAYFVGTSSAFINLNVTSAQDTGHGLDTLLAIENVTTGSGSDRLTGNAARNVLNGEGGNDIIDGGAGADVLLGRGGSDILIGGIGADAFVFDAAIGAENLDTIIDFSVPDDTIRLDDVIFTALSRGALAAGAFVANASGLAADAADRIIYETDTGTLLYDADGAGGGGAIQIAMLGSGLALSHADFLVI
ncbi:calcium-binding protein [Rhodobacter sp. CZR27]|uniref:beta strand repeat-containing protein n=1 Tax=Rhodobacter sp. CZR27 TaxID=2033869 RepID=UPI0018E07E66|nr:calcium-binding protein [Rhodobacter sp. CZR27]